jgi:ribosome-interacting GTPase 1
VGKSTFLSKVTKTKSEVAAYSFTTLTAIPGVLEYGGAEIQVLDLPGIIEGASEGKGRGRQVISAAKVSLLVSLFPVFRPSATPPLLGLKAKKDIRISTIQEAVAHQSETDSPAIPPRDLAIILRT